MTKGEYYLATLEKLELQEALAAKHWREAKAAVRAEASRLLLWASAEPGVELDQPDDWDDGIDLDLDQQPPDLSPDPEQEFDENDISWTGER